jgi:hypothetical protein
MTRSFDGAASAATWWTALCTSTTPSCDQAYGADDLQIDVETERNGSAPAKDAASAVASTPKPTRPTRPVEPAQNERRPDAKTNAAECARLLQQMSLGDSSAELTARFKSLGCR